jgi:hypothetical protein
MKKNRISRRVLKIICIVGAAAFSQRAHASIYTWDASGSNSSSPQDGPGTWSTSNLNWTTTGTGSDVGWSNSTSNSAVIGNNNNSVSGVQDITTGGALTLGNITFATVKGGGSYDVVGTSANTLGMTGSTPTVTVNTNVTAEIDAPIAVTGSQPDLTVNGAGTLAMNPSVEGSNYHGLLLGGTANVVIESGAAAAIAIPNNTTGADFDGGTLTFAATPSTDVSGRITTTSSSAVNIGVTNGALVTFATPLGGSGGLNVSGSGAGSTLKLTEGSGSQVGFSGSGGVNVNGATLFLSGNNNTELGSNTVTVGANGVLSSNSTKLVTSGSTTVNGTITGGSGDVSGDTYGNMHLSATTFSAGGAYDWKLNTAPTTAYNSGSVINSVMTGGSLNGNSLTNFDTLFSSILTDSASGFDINLVTTAGGGTPLATGTYKFAIANTASGTFNTSNFTYSGFTLSDVADSSLSSANNGGVNSELDGGTGQDLVLTYTVAPSMSPILSLTSSAPGSAYGSQITNGTGNLQGTFTGSGASSSILTVSGSSGSYTVQQVTGIKDASGGADGPNQGYVTASGFSPTSNQEIFALDVEVNGNPATMSQLNTLLTEATNTGVGGFGSDVSLSTTAPSPDPFSSNYNFFITYNGDLGDDNLGWDLLNSNDSNLVGYTVSAVAVVPEPMSLGLLVPLVGVGLMRRYRRKV